MEYLNLLLIAVLIGISGFFVLSEFSIVKIRQSRLDQLIANGSKKARAAKKITMDLDEYLSACQLGITLASLALGWVGEPTVEKLLLPLFHYWHMNEALSELIAYIFAFAAITFLHVVVGELAPKTFAIQKTEAMALAISTPLIWFNRIMFPFIWLLNTSSRILTGLFGFKPTSEKDEALSEDELRIILSQSYEQGEINQTEYNYVSNIFEFDNRYAREIMVPRLDMETIDSSLSMEEIIDSVSFDRYTRFPVIEGDKDHIIGMINSKELLSDYALNQKGPHKPISEYIHPVLMVMDTIPVHDLLIKLQEDGAAMAVLFDEYGGTSGIVTIEDILEEIVGEIRDEFDTDEKPLIHKVDDEHYILNSMLLIEEINRLLDTNISEEHIDTLGGWALTELGEAKRGDQIQQDGYIFEVKEMDGHRIEYLEAIKM